MTEQLLSITIRPPQEEFKSIKDAIDIFIEYMKPNEYIVSLEKGQKKGHFNHYQIAYISGRHVDTIGRGLNRIFKPVLSPSTLKKGVWKKCIQHNDKNSLIGYCQKEGNIYSTNIEPAKLKAELDLYNSQKKDNTKKKAINRQDKKCRKCQTVLLIHVPNYVDTYSTFASSFYEYYCPKCKRIRFIV